MHSGDSLQGTDGLSLAPFRALRPVAEGPALARLLCPPYDVIDADLRTRLLRADSDNAVGIVLPEPTDAGYNAAAQQLQDRVDAGSLRVENSPALYVYEMAAEGSTATRGLLGAVELRAPEDGVILPHENTMAGPVADRLAVMTATGTDLEPIYLIYDGGGAASALVRDVDVEQPVATATTSDGVTHRLWSISDSGRLEAVAADLRGRRALIADGHHRYATYRERQRLRRAESGAGPWDRGLALVVDSSEYGPQVHAIHRVVPGLGLSEALDRLPDRTAVELVQSSPEDALTKAGERSGFQLVLTDGVRSAVLADGSGVLAAAAARTGEPRSLSELDVAIVHRALVEQAWHLPDDVDHVLYAHSVSEAVAAAGARDGIALLLQPTPASAVAAVAAEGARMPRKSTLFTPKPASGLVMRRLIDQT